MGANKEKILLLLLGGLALGLTRSPKGYFKLIKSIHEEFKAIDQRSLKYAIDSLYKSKLMTDAEKIKKLGAKAGKQLDQRLIVDDEE